MDVRPGGKRLLCMEVHTPSGTRQMWFTGEYRVTSHHSKLVYTDAMSDSQGNVLGTRRGRTRPTQRSLRSRSSSLKRLGARA